MGGDYQVRQREGGLKDCRVEEKSLSYQSGFGNEFPPEALGGALPVGRISPQRVPMRLYAELVSGTAFTAQGQATAAAAVSAAALGRVG